MKAVLNVRSLAVLLIMLFMTSFARAEVTLLEKDGFKFSFGGFVEADAINDSTRSYSETIGNKAVSAPGTSGGDHGRTQFSIRNSRFDFKLVAPEISDWKTLGYLEYDLLGYDGDASHTGTSEAGAYTAPTLRLRHGYIQAEKHGFQITAGQTWNLLGWQPYYFTESVDIMPLPASLYSRTEQLRGMKTIMLGEKSKIEIAAAILRPPQEDSSMPDFQAGVRYSTTALQSGASGSSTGQRKLMPLSAAISGAYRQFAVQGTSGTEVDRYNGYAVAANTMIPVLPSRDGVNFSNTISLFGEFTYGEGDGDQFNQWTGNSAQPLSNMATTAPGYARRPNLDAGIGDFDPNGTFQLVKLMTFNVHAQYQLPHDMPDFIDIGYSQLFSGNMMSLTTTQDGNTSNGTNQPYNRVRSMFGNWFHDFSANLRGGLEYVYTDTNYQHTSGHNSRYQVSGFFFF